MNALGELRGGMAAERLTRLLDEVRDPLAIALAEATAVLAYLFAAELWMALAAGVAVLGVRVGAGLLMPLPASTIKPPWVLTSDEREIARLIAAGFTDPEIAEQRGLTKKAVAKRVEVILKKLGYQTREEIGEWAIAVGIYVPPKPPHVSIVDHPFVRASLAAFGFIGFGWTLYQIIRTVCQQVDFC